LPNPDLVSNEGNISDYNLFWHSDGKPMPFHYNWGEKTFADLAAWQKTGQDAHSIVAAPLFVNAAQGDFRPAKGSPAIRFVRPRMAAAAVDADGRPRDSRAYYTAGPYETGPDLAPPPPPPSGAPQPPVPVALPTNRLEALPEALAPFAAALKAMERKTLTNGMTAVEFKGIPFRLDDPPKAVRVDGRHGGKVRIPIKRGVKRLYLLHAMLNPPDTKLVGMCKVLREDGMGVGLTWVSGQNIGPSVGPWPRGLQGKPAGETSDTQLAWVSSDGSVRVFITAWDNDNYWYPLRDLEWCLMDGAATIVVLGVSVEPDK